MYIHIETEYFFFFSPFHVTLVYVVHTYVYIDYISYCTYVYIYDTWLVYIMLSEKPMEYKKNMNMCLFRLNKVYAYKIYLGKVSFL